MKTYNRIVGGSQVNIHAVEAPDDVDGFVAFAKANIDWLAVDTETTGLDIYSDNFRCRTIQFGNEHEAWVLPTHQLGAKLSAIAALLNVRKLVFQNASFDLQVLERCLGVTGLWSKVLDTKILAHLVDPRGKTEGGTGHSLEDLTRHYIDADIADGVKGLMKTLAADTKTPVSQVFATVDYQNPDYQLYAGMDTILAARLAKKLTPLVPRESRDLVKKEHRLAEVCARMEQTGFLLDVDYTTKLSERLQEIQAKSECEAASFGCENVNSTDQVADVIEARGHKITERTPSGKRKVDKVLLTRLVEQGDDFAKAVVKAKQARKWRTTWVDGFLQNMDGSGRCHPSINPLRARTARMSITGIPAQTLPAGDWMIRRCFIADEGQVMTSVDYQAQELRVLAALSGDRVMQKAFRDNEDLHLVTARAAFGNHIQKDDKERKYAKTVNFGRVYGGGVNTVAEQTGLDRLTAKRVVDGFDRAYPQVKVFSQKLQKEARDNGFIVTPTGRRLPVDQDKPYAALNYLVQSTSRDITAAGLLRLQDAGITPYLRLPIHDEVLASVPADKADRAAKRIGELMACRFKGVWIGTAAEVGGRSWGSLYMNEADRKKEDDEFRTRSV